jgi:hypothetical protein
MDVAASLVAMDENCEEYFSVVLEGNKQLRILMGLLDIDLIVEIPLLLNEDFSVVFDFSKGRLPQLSKDDFDNFYDEWLRRSGRETSMDEYGQLIFLQERGNAWNNKANRFVLREAVKAE